jgi:hypothetical protein
MSKKQDFLRSQQSRDQQAPHGQAKGQPADFDPGQQPGTGKVANDHNQAGAQEPTQTNQPRRTPESRHDRESQVGSHNVHQARTDGKGGGRGPDGAG